jgi:hypothetical protein
MAQARSRARQAAAAAARPDQALALEGEEIGHLQAGEHREGGRGRPAPGGRKGRSQPGVERQPGPGDDQTPINRPDIVM